MGMRNIEWKPTEEMKKLDELRKLDQGVDDYIEITLNQLMDYGMSEQDASNAILNIFKRVLSMEKK